MAGEDGKVGVAGRQTPHALRGGHLLQGGDEVTGRRAGARRGCVALGGTGDPGDVVLGRDEGGVDEPGDGGGARGGEPLPGLDVLPPESTDEVLARADFVLLLLPATPETEDFMDAGRLARMEPGAWLLNFGRGQLVKDDDLVGAVRAGRVAGAVPDVFRQEPLPEDHPLWQDKRVVITPHIANTQRSVREKIGAHTIKVAQAFAAGEELPTRVDPKAGY